MNKAIWYDLVNYVKACDYKVGERLRALHTTAEVFSEYEDWLQIKKLMEEKNNDT